MLYKNFERLIMPHVKYLVEHGTKDGYFATLPDMLQDQEFPDWKVLYDAMQYLFGLGRFPEMRRYASHHTHTYTWWSLPEDSEWYSRIYPTNNIHHVKHTSLYFGNVKFTHHSIFSQVHNTVEDAYLALLFSYYND